MAREDLLAVRTQSPDVDSTPKGCRGWLHKTFLVELPPHLRWAYLYFGLALVLIIGSQNFIFPVRSSVFYGILESDVHGGRAAKHDAQAKMLLPLVQLPCVLCFNMLWGFFKAPRLMISTVCAIFTGLYVAVFVGLQFQPENVPESVVDKHTNSTMPCATVPSCVLGYQPLWLGYLMYYATELKSVICPVMVWCVLNDLTPPKLAKIAYPPVVFAIQIGTLIGAFMAGEQAWFGGNNGLIIIQVAVLPIAIICGLRGVSLFKSQPMPEVFMDAGVREQQQEKQEPCWVKLWSAIEGIYLIISRPYLFGTMICSVAHLVPRLFLDFQGTQVVNQWCNDHHGSISPGGCKTSFFGWVNFIQALLTMLLSLAGTRKIVEWGGLRLSLSVLPSFAITCVLVVCLTQPAWGTDTETHGRLPNLWLTQLAIILMNTFGYGLNGPSREMLYTKTDRKMKYTAKSWSDMYGNSGMKSAASAINANFNSDTLSVGPTAWITVGWVAMWMTVAQFMGIYHGRLMRSGEIVK